MALFSGRDRTGANYDFKVDGTSASALVVMAVASAIPTPLGYEEGTATTTSQTLLAITGSAVPSGATHVRVDVQDSGGNLVYTLDGTTPTATLGEVIPAGEAGEIVLADLTAVKLRSSTGTAAFSVSYRKYT